MSSLEIYQRIQKSAKADFNLNDIALLAGQGKKSAAVTASRLVRKGILTKIERGKFCLPDEDAKAVACGIVKPSYISFLSAIFLHGGTTQIPIELRLACLKNRRALEYANERISFHKIPPKAFNGFEAMRGPHGRTYLLATPEKAVADAIAHPASCSMEEVREAVKRFGKQFDARKCRQFVQAFSSRQALKRLEQVIAYESG